MMCYKWWFKPYPMLGHKRKIYTGNLMQKMILSACKVDSVFTIGDISEKSIFSFLTNYK